MRLHRALSVLLLTAACGLVSFDVERPIPDQKVPGSPLAGLLPAALFEIPLDLDVESTTKAKGTGAATSASLKGISLTVTDPPDETFAFLDSVKISIAATGQTARELASLAPVPKQKTIDLTVVPGIDLLPYIKAGAKLTASAAGHAPSRDITFNGKVVITIKI